MSHQVEYGISITPMWLDQPVTIGLAEVADEAGLDLIGIQDHPYQWRFYDTWDPNRLPRRSDVSDQVLPRRGRSSPSPARDAGQVRGVTSPTPAQSHQFFGQSQ
jgi:hypothetical protein